MPREIHLLFRYFIAVPLLRSPVRILQLKYITKPSKTGEEPQGQRVWGVCGATLGVASGNEFGGLIGEVLVYNTDVSSNKDAIESYLSDKWDITI